MTTITPEAARLTTVCPVALSPYAIPTYLLRTVANSDGPRYTYTAGYWNVDGDSTDSAEITHDDFYATLSQHHEAVIYSEGCDYYSFDMIAAQDDAWMRRDLAMEQRGEDMDALMAELDYEIDMQLAGVR